MADVLEINAIPARKRERANTKSAANRKARATIAYETRAKKKATSAYRGAWGVRDGRGSADAIDARLIREARQSGRGKLRFSVNELRARRGLPAI